jgi:transcriptional regulator with XRE-family HTH domain
VGRKRFPTIDAYLQGTGSTQRDLAARLGITQGALSMIKNGQRVARPELALRIHELTGVPLERLLQRGAA